MFTTQEHSEQDARSGLATITDVVELTTETGDEYVALLVLALSVSSGDRVDYSRPGDLARRAHIEPGRFEAIVHDLIGTGRLSLDHAWLPPHAYLRVNFPGSRP